ncbi:unannotated protein [freshwater metagenome]|uniref:Unannotated protein n=1 Tax=freshwater metagenome TaxID=449393 RepID=A0A6J7JPJ3_9ZZZZ
MYRSHQRNLVHLHRHRSERCGGCGQGCPQRRHRTAHHPGCSRFRLRHRGRCPHRPHVDSPGRRRRRAHHPIQRHRILHLAHGNGWLVPRRRFRNSRQVHGAHQRSRVYGHCPCSQRGGLFRDGHLECRHHTDHGSRCSHVGGRSPRRHHPGCHLDSPSHRRGIPDHRLRGDNLAPGRPLRDRRWRSEPHRHAHAHRHHRPVHRYGQWHALHRHGDRPELDR